MNLSETDAQEQIERVLRSKSLQGSEVHRRLLVYLAQKSLAGEGEALKEYTIALEALGKPASYDPRHDSVVRIQIGRLRHKLTEYYHSEGATDPVVLRLPKGSFKVNFESALPAPAPPPPAPPVEDQEWKRIAIGLGCIAIAAALWAAVASVKLLRTSEAATSGGIWNASLQEIWGPFLESKRPLLVCVGTPLFANIPDRGFLRLPKALTWDDLRKSKAYAAVTAVGPGGPGMPWYSFTGVGEAGSAFAIGKLLGARGRDVLMTRSNLLSWQEVSDTNLIFLGPPKFNSQLHAISSHQEITIEPDGVRILHPGKGEPAFLPDKFIAGPQFDGTTHALISRTPGLSGDGEMLTLAGNGSPDTLAAAQWVTQPSLAAELIGHLRRPDGKLPSHYQVVLKVDFRNGVPMKTGYVLHRVLDSK